MQQSHFIQRPRLLQELTRSLQESPITVLLGARQTGKSTLAGMWAAKKSDIHFFDLEKASDRSSLSTPETTLGSLSGVVVIDEIQRMPSLFATLRPLADRNPLPARFLLLGSASPSLIKGVSESLAGRVLFVHVPGFTIDEIQSEPTDRLWVRGGFPRSFLAKTESESWRWRQAFITTFLERDIPQLGIRVPAETLRRFWIMLAHYHGQIWNSSELARSLGTNEKTARHYLDILTGAYVTRILPPWYENVGKRQVKSPKVYVRDAGLLHSLLGLENIRDVRAHPKYGASWEGFALQQTITMVGEDNVFFWSTQRGAELDLLVMRHGKRYGFEFKCSDAPAMTRSLHIASEELGLSRAWIVYPGERDYPAHESVEAIPLNHLPKTIAGIING
jgi:predicted AAA+ superfamily ATPase